MEPVKRTDPMSTGTAFKEDQGIFIRSDDQDMPKQPVQVGQNKPPAKITMNIPSFLPKTMSSVKKAMEPQEIQVGSGKPIINPFKNVIIPTHVTIQSPKTSPKINNPITSTVNPIEVPRVPTTPTSVTQMYTEIDTMQFFRSLKSGGGGQSSNITKMLPSSSLLNPLEFRDQIRHNVNPLLLCMEDPLASGPDLPEDSSKQKCHVPGCSHTKSAVISLFNVPKILSKTWCQILGINHENMTLDDVANLQICSEHFDLSQFVEGSGCKVLKQNAIPRSTSFSINSISDSEGSYVNIVPILEKPIPLQIQDLVSPDLTIQSFHAYPETQNTQLITQPTIRYSSLANQQQIMMVPSNTESINFQPPPKVQVMSTEFQVSSFSPNTATENRANRPSLKTKKNNVVQAAQKVQRSVPGTVGRPVLQQSLQTKSILSQNQKFSRPTYQKKKGLLSQNPIVTLGPYARPNLKVKSENVKIDDLANLVMPSEDWSVNIYPSPIKDKPTSQVYTVSETILNSDMVEIVRKSITIHQNWAMKFSIMSRDMSHFNLGLAACDISDVQAVLDNFSGLKFCKGLADVLQSKSYASLTLSMKTQVERFVDNVFRSVKCPLLIIGSSFPSSDKSKLNDICTSCLGVVNSLTRNQK